MLVVLFGVLLVVMSCGKVVEQSGEDTESSNWFGQLKIIISFGQIFSTMINGVLTSVPWPNNFLSFSEPLLLSNMDFVTVLSSNSCSLSVRFFEKFVVHMLLLPCCMLVIFLAWMIGKTLIIKKDDTDGQARIKAEMYKAIILVMLLLFPGISTKVFTVWKCTHIEGLESEQWKLEEDYNMSCYDGEHSTLMVMSVVCGLVYIIGIPLSMFFSMWINRAHLHDKTSPKYHHVHFELGGLYDGCECCVLILICLYVHVIYVIVYILTDLSL